MRGSERLVLWHFWVAFVALVFAVLLGVWQMWHRTPLAPWLENAEAYYRSITIHGTALAYVFPTLIAMGFGYAVVESALAQDEVVQTPHHPGREHRGGDAVHPLGLDRLRPPEAAQARQRHHERQADRQRLLARAGEAGDEHAGSNDREDRRRGQQQEGQRRRAE